MLALDRGADVGSGTKKLVDEVDALIDAEHKRGPFGERLAMLSAFRRFLAEKFLVATAKFDAEGDLNRHGILHGVFSDYGSIGNFYRLISFLDFLCFFVAMSRSGISVLAPAWTPETI